MFGGIQAKEAGPREGGRRRETDLADLYEPLGCFG